MAVGQVAERDSRSSAFWGGPFVLGLLMMLVGLLALSTAVWTSLASIVFLGVLVAFSGLVQIVHGFRYRKTGASTGTLLGGILSAVIGVLIVARPGAGLAAVTLLLIGFFFVSGLFRTITSVLDRYEGWSFDLAYGVSAIVLGVILAASWPASALWLIGTLVGLEILFRGSALMAGSLALRRVVRHEGRATA